MTLEKRMELERRVVRKLIRVAKEHGWTCVAVDDGEERVRCDGEAEAMDAVFAVDESVMRFKHADHKATHCAVIVLGNDGWDAIADWSVGDGWADVMEAMDAYTDKLCEEVS